MDKITQTIHDLLLIVRNEELPKELLGELEFAGVTEEQIKGINVDNPKTLLCIMDSLSYYYARNHPNPIYTGSE